MNHYPATQALRRFAAAIVAAACVVATCARPALAERRTIVLDAAQLTREAAAHFPQRSCLLGAACVTLSDPRVVLRDADDRIFVVASAMPEMPGAALPEGVVELAGVPRYDAGRGAFFLDRASITRADFAGLPPAYARMASRIVGELLDDYLRSTPIHSLDERDARQSLAKLVLREVRVRDGRLELTIGDDD
ncbi:MAG: DUF1439 domain-containing protein [Lautropia sp.]